MTTIQVSPPNFRGGYLQQGAPVGMLVGSVSLAADNTAVSLEGISCLQITSDDTTAANRTFTLAQGSLLGQQVVLELISGSSTTCQLANSGTVKLAAAWEPIQYQTLTIYWDGNYWVEQQRSNVTLPGSTALTSAHLFVGNASNLAADVAVTGDVTISNTGVTAIGAGKVTQAMNAAQAVGLNVSRVCIGLFDPSANTGERTIAAHTIAVALPAKAIITQFYYQVLTTFTSATDAATIALSVEGANDLVSAIAISDGSNPWDAAGTVAGIPVGTAATMVKTTVARQITATVAIEALTAGKMYIYADYVQGF
jgi:hypothetical protein